MSYEYDPKVFITKEFVDSIKNKIGKIKIARINLIDLGDKIVNKNEINFHKELAENGSNVYWIDFALNNKIKKMIKDNKAERIDIVIDMYDEFFSSFLKSFTQNAQHYHKNKKVKALLDEQIYIVVTGCDSILKQAELFLSKVKNYMDDDSLST